MYRVARTAHYDLYERDLASARRVAPPAGLEVRRLEREELPRLHVLMTSRRRAHLARDTAHCTMFAAFRGDRIVGYSWCTTNFGSVLDFSPLTLPADAIFHGYVHVARAERHGGMASALFSASDRFFHEQGVRAIWYPAQSDERARGPRGGRPVVRCDPAHRATQLPQASLPHVAHAHYYRARVTAPTVDAELSAQPTTAAPAGRGRRIVLYAATRGTTEAMRSARGLLLAIVLGPRAFGIWTLFRIVMRYTPLSGLGVQRGLELEIVQERAIGTEEALARADEATRTTLGWIIVTALGASLAALLASFIVTDPAWQLALRAVSLGVLLEELWVYATTYLRALRELRRYAVLEIVSAALHLVAAIALAFAFGLRGAIAGFVVGALASLWTVRRCAPFRPELQAPALRRLLGVGVPLALSSALTIALGTADRLVVAAYGGAATLGLYAFGVSIAGLAASLAWIIRTVIFPDVYGSARVAGAAPAMREHLERTVLPFAALFPPILGALAIAMEPAVALALPRYLAAAPAARVFIFSAAASGITTLGAIGMVAVGRQRLLPMLSAIALCINLVCSMLALHFGLGLAAVAGGAVLAQATIAAGVLAIVASQAAHARALPFVLRGMLPLVWCLALVILLARLYDPRALGGGAASLGTYLLLLLPITPLMRAGLRNARGIARAAPYTE